MRATNLGNTNRVKKSKSVRTGLFSRKQYVTMKINHFWVAKITQPQARLQVVSNSNDGNLQYCAVTLDGMPLCGIGNPGHHWPVTNLLLQLCLPKWSSLPISVQLSILAGSTPPTIWKSTQADQWHWFTQLTPHADSLAYQTDQQLKLALTSNTSAPASDP